jgi:tetratricopeptide (TPR) repeat protein
VRNGAATQYAIADVLVQQGMPQEALAFYEQALRTTQELGDMREVAVTQANFCQLLFQQGEYHRVLSMAWEAYTILHKSGFTYDAQVVQQLLISIKGQMLGPVQYNALWVQVIHQPQPDWLRDVQANVLHEPAQLSPEQLES